MEQIDRVLYEEFHRGAPEIVDVDRGLAESSGSLERRHRTRVIRGASVAAVLAVILVAVVVVGVVGFGRTPTSSPAHRQSVPAPFDPAAELGGFTVEPSTGLADQQAVTVSIHGLRPNGVVWIAMCVGHPKTFRVAENECLAIPTMASLNGHGAARVRFIVDRYPFQVDCATYSAGCSIGLVDPTSVGSREFVGNIEPVTFKNTESKHSNPLHMTISPGSPYADGQVVPVSGTGYSPGSSVRIAECPNNNCEGRWQTVPTTAQGSFTASLTLHRTLVDETGTQSGGETRTLIDCGIPFTCFMTAQETLPPYSSPSSNPITFAASKPG